MHDVDELRINVVRLCRGLLFVFALTALWLGYWHVIRAPQLRADSHNPRATERLKLTQPGRVLTRDGAAVLEGRKDHGVWYLEYPGREVYCHLTGYNAAGGLQVALHDALYAQGQYEDPWCRILRGRPTGCDIGLTIDGGAQTLATREMAGKCGAVVAMDPRDGAIRVLVSAPGYDPTSVLVSAADYELFRNNPDKPELDRAVAGQYAPGSALKILTAAAALDRGVVKPSDTFECSGQVKIDQGLIRCRRANGHGRISLTTAMADSCNVVFAEIGRGLGPATFLDYVNRFRLTQRPRLPLYAREGRMPAMVGPKAELQVAEAAFGQGRALVTPIAMARLAATIANAGVVPQLRIVDHITGAGGKAYYRLTPGTDGQAVAPQAARETAGMMVATVERGTGRRAQIPGVAVAGKTGSAENPAGPPHAWFVGFAPADRPRVAVAVIVENGGAGGEVAAPIAQRVMRELLAPEERDDAGARGKGR